MSRRLLAAFVTLSLLRAAAAQDHKLEAVAELPKGLGEKIAAQLDPNGQRVTGPDGVICEIWFAKGLALKPGFKATLFEKYPFTQGQLVGAIRLPTKSAALDFRGQELQTGVFTLRYGLQPQDGAHLGSSDVRDFLLACTAEMDVDPKTIENPKEMFKLSAKVAGSTHPAIFLLMPPPMKAYEKPALKHNDDKDWWLLQQNVAGKAGDAVQTIPVQVVVAGQTAG